MIKSNSAKGRIWLLDVIRGFSALLIVLYHYTTRYDISIGHIDTWPVSFPWGCYAVYTFFTLSGFLTVYNLNPKDGAGKYLIKRAIRLYPVFWIAIIITTIYMFFLMPERLSPPMTILANFTMVPSLLGFGSVDGVYWTLAKELVFYVTIAALIKTKTIKHLGYLQLPWLLIVCLATFYCNSQINFPAQSLASFVFIVESAHSFIFGISVYYLLYSEKKDVRAISCITMLLCVVYSAVVKGMDSTIFFAAMGICIIFCVWLSKKHDVKKSKLWTPITYIAEISYPLYLTHQFIGFAVIQFIENKLGLTNEFFIIIPILHAIILATVIHYCFELPVTRKLSSLLKKRSIK